jgi:hypothetical protein
MHHDLNSKNAEKNGKNEEKRVSEKCNTIEIRVYQLSMYLAATCATRTSAKIASSSALIDMTGYTLTAIPGGQEA